MKTVKLNVKMCCCLVLFMALLGGCSDYPEYEVTNPPFTDITSLDMYVGDEVQITASPTNASFRWSIDNDTIVSVSQTGKVTALREGLATITVASENDELKIDVRVKTFVPLERIALTVEELTVDILGEGQIWAFPVPENASESDFTWTSTKPEVATVDATGLVKPVSMGTTEIVISLGNIENRLTVIIGEIYTVVPLIFSDRNAMNSSWNEEGGYWDFRTTGYDPYISTSTLPEDVRNRTSVYFVVEYQCSYESNQGQIFYGRPGYAGGVSTDMSLHFDNTGIDPDDESKWYEFRFNLADAINVHNWGAVGHRLRFDFIQDDIRVTMLVRNVRVEYR
jgi:hypothetical protein